MSNNTDIDYYKKKGLELLAVQSSINFTAGLIGWQIAKKKEFSKLAGFFIGSGVSGAITYFAFKPQRDKISEELKRINPALNDAPPYQIGENGNIIFKKKYGNINDTLYWIIEQAKASYPYAVENFTPSTPEQIFNTFRNLTEFHSDPKGVELIQSLPTLLTDNYHGISGAGDCDCFVTSLIALLWASGYTDISIVLTGRDKKTPKHIYLYVYVNGTRYTMDATQAYYDSERHYPYKQEIPISF